MNEEGAITHQSEGGATTHHTSSTVVKNTTTSSRVVRRVGSGGDKEREEAELQRQRYIQSSHTAPLEDFANTRHDFAQTKEFAFVRRIVPADGSATEGSIPTEIATLDYTPCVAIRPIDMTERLRPSKALRKIRLMICVTVYDEVGDEL